MRVVLAGMRLVGAEEDRCDPLVGVAVSDRIHSVAALEAEMEASGTFVFGGALHGPDAATVIRVSDGGPVMTDGPYVESKEHIAGVYIINADDLDAALRC